MINLEIDLGHDEEPRNIYGSVIKSDKTYDGLTGVEIKKVIDKVMSEPNFRRGVLETQVFIHTDLGTEDGYVNVSLGLFDEWDEEGDEDGWGESPIWKYNLSEL